MAKTKETSNTEETRTEPQTFGPEQDAGNIAAAWQGLYHLLGARVERWDVTNDGVYAVNLTFDASKIPSVEQVIHDISYRNGKHINRQLDLVFLYPIVKDNAEPPAFEDAASLTEWMAQYTRDGTGDGDSNRSPQYVKDAISAYKKDRNMPSRQGRPATKLTIEYAAFGSIPPEALRKVDPDELDKFLATVQKIRAEQEQTASA